MPAQRILTWLFIAASVALDCAILTATWTQRDLYEFHPLLQGIALGQVGALAIWTVCGELHRLARGACLVFGTGAIAVATIGSQDWYAQKWLAQLGVYAVLVVAVVAALEFARRTVAERRAPHEMVQTPLIELFGWTIVVAIVSFGTRYMDFEVLGNGLEQLPRAITLIAVPVGAYLLYRPPFQFTHLLKWLLFVGVAGVAGYFLASKRLTPAVFAVQAAYLAAWMIVREVESQPAVVQDQIDEPKIYEPPEYESTTEQTP